MKDRMIIIREGVVFVITVSHEEPPVKAVEETNEKTSDQNEAEFPYILISAN